LTRLATGSNYLFSVRDLAAILPGHSQTAFNALLGRAEKNGIISRVCRGLYLNPQAECPAGMVLYHAAARLRAQEFNYLSLESVLSDSGVISQVAMNWITLMSSGRSNTISCGSFGHIEFIHSKRESREVASQLTYDTNCRLWRASVALALKDMKLTRRSLDLVNWEIADELV
jgi:hypothetical protein